MLRLQQLLLLAVTSIALSAIFFLLQLVKENGVFHGL